MFACEIDSARGERFEKRDARIETSGRGDVRPTARRVREPAEANIERREIEARWPAAQKPAKADASAYSEGERL